VLLVLLVLLDQLPVLLLDQLPVLPLVSMLLVFLY
jgi:hypothetical protein